MPFRVGLQYIADGPFLSVHFIGHGVDAMRFQVTNDVVAQPGAGFGLLVEHGAYAALYLASDESKFVTGTELIVDGGYMAQ